ncbi:MAG: 4-hydroxy-3-methylbut-2-enyl diphosphate reductase [Lachnospiraceae bacterium]|nr:4-hydroxy-3-methylbut-2-enyl diphosphate reductase [Lachnospiraceae bacterium]
MTIEKDTKLEDKDIKGKWFDTASGGRVFVAKNAGFCFGVNRAINMTYDIIGSRENIYTYGPIIHNEEVVKELEDKGVYAIDSADSIRDKNATVILRTHGVTREVKDDIEARNFEVIDTTCPFVKKIHRLVDEASSRGEKVIIVGDINHPELIGIRGWCNNEPIVIKDAKEAEKIAFGKESKVCVVFQTTFDRFKYKEIVDILKKNCYYVNIVNTICNATEERQTEARELAEKMDAILIIGGTKSSNTRKLYEICLKECKNSFFVQNVSGMDLVKIKAASSIGITAGASTPNNIIQEVLTHVRINF